MIESIDFCLLFDKNTYQKYIEMEENGGSN